MGTLPWHTPGPLMPSAGKVVLLLLLLLLLLPSPPGHPCPPPPSATPLSLRPIHSRERLLLVKWQGRPVEECTWEWEGDLVGGGEGVGEGWEGSASYSSPSSTCPPQLAPFHAHARAAVQAFYATWAPPPSTPQDPSCQVLGRWSPGGQGGGWGGWGPPWG